MNITQNFVNPYKDKLTGHEGAQLLKRLQNYTKNYDNTEYDLNPEKGVTDTFNREGNPSLGSSMKFSGDLAKESYHVSRFSYNEKANKTTNVRDLSVQLKGDTIQIFQRADYDGDGEWDANRETHIDIHSNRVTKMVDHIPFHIAHS